MRPAPVTPVAPATPVSPADVVVIGAGPSGLMAAEQAAMAGARVALYEQMPSVARKFLMAGRGGLNLTHGQDLAVFLKAYGAGGDWLRSKILDFKPQDLRAWADGLGGETFVGSSGRIFPKAMKASPLLRAWLRRLDALHVRVFLRHRFVGWSCEGSLNFERTSHEKADKRISIQPPKALVLAFGGASWPRLGSDGAGLTLLQGIGLATTAFVPSNMGLRINWSSKLKEMYAGQALKNIDLSLVAHGKGCLQTEDLISPPKRGEAMLTSQGLEGGLIYACSRQARTHLDVGLPLFVNLDLLPELSYDQAVERFYQQRAKLSLSAKLVRAFKLSKTKIGLLQEFRHARQVDLSSHLDLAQALKSLRFPVQGHAGLARAISSAGGLKADQLDDNLMLISRPGLFVCGELLDWEAPTGGYLLQACFATGWTAGRAAAAYCQGEVKGQPR